MVTSQNDGECSASRIVELFSLCHSSSLSPSSSLVALGEGCGEGPRHLDRRALTCGARPFTVRASMRSGQYPRMQRRDHQQKHHADHKQRIAPTDVAISAAVTGKASVLANPPASVTTVMPRL